MLLLRSLLWQRLVLPLHRQQLLLRKRCLPSWCFTDTVSETYPTSDTTTATSET